MGFIVRYGSVVTPFPLHCSLRKDICCRRLSLQEGGNRSLDFQWHNSMSYWVGKTTVLQAVTRFSAACISASVVLLHDGLLHHCRLRKIPLRHSQRWPWAVVVE
jgi:hypothetical protein